MSNIYLLEKADNEVLIPDKQKRKFTLSVDGIGNDCY